MIDWCLTSTLAVFQLQTLARNEFAKWRRYTHLTENWNSSSNISCNKSNSISLPTNPRIFTHKDIMDQLTHLTIVLNSWTSTADIFFITGQNKWNFLKCTKQHESRFSGSAFWQYSMQYIAKRTLVIPYTDINNSIGAILVSFNVKWNKYCLYEALWLFYLSFFDLWLLVTPLLSSKTFLK